MEALAFAIRSKWDIEDERTRKAVVLFTNASSNKLGQNKAREYYPRGMPEKLTQMGEWWEAVGAHKSMMLLAPLTHMWECVSQRWDNVWHLPLSNFKSLDEEVAVLSRIIAREASK